MAVETYIAALALVLFSLVLGRALCAVCTGNAHWWAAPAVGFAVLLVLCGAGVRIPGRATTAIVFSVIALLLAVVVLVRRRIAPVRPPDLLIGGLALLGASLPFLSSGRVGVLGAGLDNDMAVHLLWAEALRSSRMAHLWNIINGAPQPPYNGYPLGPHAVVAALGSATGMGLDAVFTGLMLAVIVLIALVAAELLARQALWRRAVIALACSLTYLLAAFYAEGSFKETTLALLLVGFVLHLLGLRERWAEADPRGRWAFMVPAVVLGAGAVYNYSYLGLSWFAATLVIWAVAEVAVTPSRLTAWRSRERLRREVPWVVATAALGLVLLLPVIGQAVSFFTSYGVSPAAGALSRTNLGNLVAPLSPYEALGVWASGDFRHFPLNTFHAGELSLFALAVMLFGLWWSLRRREFILPAAVGACWLIWWYSDRTQSPYIAAKALAIASPLFVAVGLRALLTRERRSPSGLPYLRRAWPYLLAAAVFCGFAAYASALDLRNEPLQTPEGTRELAAFHRITGNGPLLFLGVDDFAPWQLREAAVSTLSPPTFTQGQAAARTTKPFVGGQPLDFDSVDPASLNTFRYVVTPSGQYASQPPANFRLVRAERLYDLWERTGPTPARWAIDQPGAPGAILNCSAYKLGNANGVASVMTPPHVLPGFVVVPGTTGQVQFALPAGRWELSVQYFSDLDFDMSAQGRTWHMPAHVGRTGPWFQLGGVLSQGPDRPVAVTVNVPRPTPLTGHGLVTVVTGVAATAQPNTETLVPLRQACGKYVDWYRLAPTG